MPRRFPLMPRDAQPPMSEGALRWTAILVATVVLVAPLAAAGLYCLATETGYLPTGWRSGLRFEGTAAVLLGWSLIAGAVGMLAHALLTEFTAIEHVARRMSLLAAGVAILLFIAALVMRSI